MVIEEREDGASGRMRGGTQSRQLWSNGASGRHRPTVSEEAFR
jgi:hypothetical protein